LHIVNCADIRHMLTRHRLYSYHLEPILYRVYMDQETSQTIALQALIWILADDDRAQRLLSITGITPDDMRTSLSESWLLEAALSYLEGYEPDLIECSKEIKMAPEQIIAASNIISSPPFDPEFS